MAGEFNRVLQTTIAEYLLGAEDNVVRTRKILALAKAKSRITFNHSGKELDWGIRYKRRGIEGYADGMTLSFGRSDVFKRATLPWRGYTMTDMVTKKEKLMNRGKPALIKYVSELVDAMMDDFGEAFNGQLYIDGNASGNELLLHGIESFFGTSGTTGKVGTPADTYAGLSTAPGTYGGAWTGTWPGGTGDPEYDFWSPVVVDYTNTNFAATTKTWPNTCVEAIRFGILKAKRNDSKKGMLDLVIHDQDLYEQFVTSLDSKETIEVKTGPGEPTLRNLGWGDTIWFEGCEHTWEFGVPTDSAGEKQSYGLNFDQMELCSLQDRLFVSEGPFYDEASLSDRFAIHMFGNLKFNPRYFVKWKKIS
jgi:hypothetical protein